MKILLIHPHDIYSVDEPWTSRIRNIAKELNHKGHEVKLVYFPLPSPEKNNNFDTKKLEGVETIPLNRNKWAIIKNIDKVCTLSKWADIVHFQKCFAYSSIPAIFGAYFANKHLHYDWDDWEYRIYQASGPSKLVGFYINFLEMIIPRMVDSISVASDYLKVLAKKRGVPEEKIFESHVCADLRVFKPKNSRRVKKKYHIRFPLVLYQGQLQGAQYAYLFIESAKIVKQEISDVKFMIVGGGYNLPKLKELAKILDLEENIIFTDFILHEEVPDYISAADVVVACFEENDLTKCKSPLKIVEYMACGKAVVASDVGEVKKMLGGCGILVKPGDTTSLAQGIIKLLKDHKLRFTNGKKALERAIKYYHWGVTVDNLLKAYTLQKNRHKGEVL